MESVKGIGGVSPVPQGPEKKGNLKETKDASQSQPHQDPFYKKIVEIMGEKYGKQVWNAFINTQISMMRQSGERATRAMKQMGQSQ